MGDKADCRNFLRRIGRQGSHQVALVIEGDVFQSYLFQLFHQRFGKHALSRRTGSHTRGFARLGVERHVLQKSICYSHKLIINITSHKSN